MDNINLKVETVGSELVVREGYAKPIFDYTGFQHKVSTSRSFCDLVKARTKDAENCVVFSRENGFFAILDDTVINRPQDTVQYIYTHSVRAQEWASIIRGNGTIFSIKEMINFLKRREEGEISCIEEFMYAAQNFKYAVLTEGDFTRDNDHNYVVAIKVKEVEGTVRVPETITVNMELYQNSGFFQDIEIEVEIHRPKNENDGRPGFKLSCPKIERYEKAAKDKEAELIQHELDGYLLLEGVR